RDAGVARDVDVVCWPTRQAHATIVGIPLALDRPVAGHGPDMAVLFEHIQGAVPIHRHVDRKLEWTEHANVGPAGGELEHPSGPVLRNVDETLPIDGHGVIIAAVKLPGTIPARPEREQGRAAARALLHTARVARQGV